MYASALVRFVVGSSGLLLLALGTIALRKFQITGGLVGWLFFGVMASSGGFLHWLRLRRPEILDVYGWRLLAVLTVAVRCAWIASCPTIPVSDFDLYRTHADLMSHWTTLPEFGRGGYLAPWGWPFLLAIVYSFLPATVLVAQTLVVLCSVWTLRMTWLLARHFGGVAGAATAGWCFAIWPSYIHYSSVLGTEHVAIPAMLTSVWLTTVIIPSLWTNSAHRADAMVLLYSLFSGVVCGMGFVTRSMVGIALPAMIVSSALLTRLHPTSNRAMRVLIMTSGLVAGFSLVSLGFPRLCDTVFGSRPHSGMTWSLLVGTNQASSGQWNEPDSVQYSAFPTFSEANAFARRQSLSRLTRDPWDTLRLFARKQVIMWEYAGWGFGWATLELQPGARGTFMKNSTQSARMPAQAFLFGTLLFAGGSCFQIFRRRSVSMPAVCLMLIVLGSVAAHTLLEVQPRYQAVSHACILVLLGSAVRSTDTQRHAKAQQPG